MPVKASAEKKGINFERKKTSIKQEYYLIYIFI
jgi:hypothetical protein